MPRPVGAKDDYTIRAGKGILPGMVKDYWRRVRKKAWADTVSALRLDWLWGLVMWVTGTLAAVAGLLLWGSEDAARDELVVRIFLAFVAVAAIPLVFAWKLMATPARIESEQEKTFQARMDLLQQDITSLKGDVSDLREAAAPRIIFGDTIEDEEILGPDGHLRSESRSIRIKNAGNEILKECIVTVERVELDNGVVVEPYEALRTVGKAADKRWGPFKLRPDSPKRLLITRRETPDPRNPGQHRLMMERSPSPLPRGRSGVIYLAAGAEVGTPARVKLRFTVDKEYKLSLERVTSESRDSQELQGTRA